MIQGNCFIDALNYYKNMIIFYRGLYIMMRNIQYFAFSIFFLGLFFVSGCARYKLRQLRSLPTIKSGEAEDITLGAKVLSDDDMYYYFSRRIKARGYKAIQLHIKNDSSRHYILNAYNIGIQIAERQAVAQMLHLNTGKRVVTYAIPGAFLSGILLIPAAVEGSMSSSANNKLDQDFARRVLDNETSVVIPPNAEVNRVFFVADSDFHYQFDVILTPREVQKNVTFVVNV